MKTLIRAYDVINKTTLSNNTSPVVICNHLDCEENLLRSCLGDVYDLMVRDSNNVIESQKNLPEWDEEKEYAKGDKVIFCGACFVRNSNEIPEDVDEEGFD